MVEACDNVLLKKTYDEKKVPQWINQICEQVMKKLVEKSLPFKYMVNCLIMQRNTAGMFSVTSCYYDTSLDFIYPYQWPKEKAKMQENKTMYCLVTVFGI